MGIFKEKYTPRAERVERLLGQIKKSDFKKSKLKFKQKLQAALKSHKTNPDFQGSATPPNPIHLALSKMAFGPSPEDVAHIQSLSGANDEAKIMSYIDEQLNYENVDDSYSDSLLQGSNGFTTLNKTRKQLYQQHVRRPNGSPIDWDDHIRPSRETVAATYIKGVHSKRQLFETMTDFWHNHFSVYLYGDGIPGMFVEYDRDVIRANALGNFHDMLYAMTRSTCMMMYLGNALNNVTEPNENFARELLELFTMGGTQYYREIDIKEAARAFTGWGIDDRTGKYRFYPERHDTGLKTFMGQRGNFNGDDILMILMKHPRTAETIAEKMWGEFINSSKPNAAYTRRWATQFRNSNYDIKALLIAVLSSDAFWDSRNMGALVKSPVELTVGTMRALPYRLRKNNLAHNLSIMGQSLFAHGSVKGWSGGNDWISTQSLMRRTGLLTNLTRGNLRKANDAKMMRHMPNCTDEELITWLLPVPPLNPLPTQPGRQRLVRALVLDPAYQVS